MTESTSRKSYKDPFVELGSNFNVKTLSDDFVHSALETVKFKGATGNNGNFSYKVKSKLDEKDSKFSSDTELKIDFPLCKQNSLWFGIRTGKGAQQHKIHLDLGERDFGKHKLNPFVNVKTTVERKNFEIRLGANYWGKSCESGTRLAVRSDNWSEFSLTQRNLIRHSNFVFGFVLGLCLSKVQLGRNDLVLGYEDKKFDAYLRHLQVDGPCCKEKEGKGSDQFFKLGKAVLDVAYKHNDKHTVALSGEHQFESNAHTITVGHNSKVNDELSVRNRFDSNLKYALALKYKVCKKLSLALSSEFDFKNAPIDTSKTIPFPVGIQFEFNI